MSEWRRRPDPRRPRSFPRRVGRAIKCHVYEPDFAFNPSVHSGGPRGAGGCAASRGSAGVPPGVPLRRRRRGVGRVVRLPARLSLCVLGVWGLPSTRRVSAGDSPQGSARPCGWARGEWPAAPGAHPGVRGRRLRARRCLATREPCTAGAHPAAPRVVASALEVLSVCQVEPGYFSEMRPSRGPRGRLRCRLQFKRRKDIFVAFQEGFLYPALCRAEHLKCRAH